MWLFHLNWIEIVILKRSVSFLSHGRMNIFFMQYVKMCEFTCISNPCSLGLDVDLSFDPPVILNPSAWPHTHNAHKSEDRVLWIYHILDMNHAYKVTKKHENKTLQSKLLPVCTSQFYTLVEYIRFYFTQKSCSTHTHTHTHNYIYCIYL